MIITSINTAEVRVVLRVYFLVVLALTGFFVRRVLHGRNKLRILGGGSILATRALNSLDGLDLLLAPLKLRALPSGAFGFSFLLFLFVLGKAADLLTSYLVVNHLIQSRCSFGQGLVFDDGANLPMPPFNGRPFQVVQNAQLLAVNNSCPYGIYKKLNTDSSFCPEKRDILGSWNCNIVNDQTPQSWPSGTNSSDIAQGMNQKGLIYDNGYVEQTQWSSGFVNHLVIWSTSATLDSDGSLWSVKAAVETTYKSEDDIQLTPLTCSVSASGAEQTIRGMASGTTLKEWVPTFQGLMYNGFNTSAIQDVQDALAILLNTITMISGGNNYLLAEPGPGQDKTQGCLARAAYVPTVMVVIFLAVAGLGVTAFVAWCITSIRLFRSPSELEALPLSAEEWATFAAREYLSTANNNHGVVVAPVETSELKSFSVGFSQPNIGRIGMFQRRQGNLLFQ
ncbi:hypothetical protein FDENT_7879 [Fusarium denticulatum]|uniref:Uncharacterized protein n=1 Tax=Fusarium denticulatum TaxID=48507 RepID=A0A8H5U0T0_9HYPO|nr:hypothetical protein FDENT_7879 [Fusarium denticulatum]